MACHLLGGGGALRINLDRDAHLRIFSVYPKNNRLQISTPKKYQHFLVPKTNVILVLQLR